MSSPSEGAVAPDNLMGPVHQAWASVVAYAPVVVSGLLVLVIGWLVANLLRTLVARVLKVSRLDQAVEHTRLARILAAFREGFTLSQAIANLARLAILLLAAMASADVMGLQAVEDAVGSALSYVPRLVAALLVIGIGGFAAGSARRAVAAVMAEMRSAMAGALESITEIGILTIAAIVAVEMLGVDVSFVTSSIGLILGILLVTIAFLFAWSMRRPAEELVANYYLRRLVRLGDEVELGEIRGVAERFCPLGILLRTADGRQHFVPARHLLTGMSRRQADPEA